MNYRCSQVFENQCIVTSHPDHTASSFWQAYIAICLMVFAYTVLPTEYVLHQLPKPDSACKTSVSVIAEHGKAAMGSAASYITCTPHRIPNSFPETTTSSLNNEGQET